MYSPSSSSAGSASSSDSYDRRRRLRPHRSRNRNTIKSMFEGDIPIYRKKETRKLSPLVTRHGLHHSKGSKGSFDLNDEKQRSHRKKTAYREYRATVSRKELDEIKRQHERELKNLLKFLEKESSLLNGIEEEKREELHELKRQHEKEVRKLFEFQENEITAVTEKCARKQAELEELLERSQTEAYEESRRCQEQILALEEDLKLVTEELKSTTQKASYEKKKAKEEMNESERQASLLENEVLILREKFAETDARLRKMEGVNSKVKMELGSSERQASLLENEVVTLREKFAETDARLRQMEGINAKSSFVEEQLRDEIRRKDEELRRKDREIRSLSSRVTSAQEKVESINISGYEWEDASGLTSSSDFDLRERIPMKYGFSSDRGRKTSNSASIRRDNRDDIDPRRLAVSFSDEVEKRILPMQAHDSLSRRLDKMYLSK